MLQPFSHAGILSLLLAQTAMSQNDTWTGTTDGNWNTGTNWGNGVPASAIDTALLFDGTLQPLTTNNIPGGLTLNSLTVGENSGGREFDGNALTFDGAGARLRSLTPAGDVVFFNHFQLNQSLEIEGGRNFGAQLLLGGNISGAGGITFEDGISTIYGSNTFTGATVIRSGAVVGVAGGGLAGTSGVAVESGGELEIMRVSPTTGTTIHRSLELAGVLSSTSKKVPLAIFGDPIPSTTWSGAITLTGDATVLAFGGTAGNAFDEVALRITGGVNLAGHKLTIQTDGFFNQISVAGAISGNGNILLKDTSTNGGSITLQNVGGNGTLEVDIANNFLQPATVAGNLTGNRNIQVNNGTLRLSGAANTFAGSILSAGSGSEISVSNSSGLGDAANAVTLQNGGALRITTAGTIGRAIHLDGGGVLIGSNATLRTYTGEISGTGGLEVALGAHRLSGNNPFTGGLRINGGAVFYTNDSNLGAAGEAVRLISRGSLILPTSLTNFNRPIEVVTSTSGFPGSLSLQDGSNGREITVGSDISGDGWLQLGERAVWNLTGNNTITGGLKVVGDNGWSTTIIASSAANLGSATAGLILGDQASNFTERPVILRAAGDLDFESTRTTTYRGLTVDTNGHTVTFNQALTGVGGLRKNGEGELVIQNGGNNMTGQFRIAGGSARFGAENALGAAGASVRLDSGTSLDVGGHNQRFTSLSGDLGSELHLGGGTLTLGGGSMHGDISGSGGLVLGGGGEFFSPELALGGSNTFTGGILIKEFARLNVQSTGALGGPGNAITLDNGGIVVGTLLPAPLVMGSDSNLTIGAGGASFHADGQSIIIESALGGSSPIRFAGGSEPGNETKYDVRLANPANTFTGNIQLGDADRSAYSAVVLGIVSNGSLGNASNVVTLGDSFNNGEGGDRPAQGGLRAYADLTLPASRAIQLKGTSEDAASSGGFIDTNGHTVIVESAISETSSGMQLVKTGAGTLLLEGQNTYTGVTDVRQGTLGGSGAIMGSLKLANTTTLAPGSSAGIFTVAGNLQSYGSTFEFEIGGTTRGTGYDGLDIGGSFDLTEGLSFLSLSLLSSFHETIQATDSFLLIDAGSFSGAFDNIANGERLMTADGLGSFLVHYGSGSAHDPNHVVVSDFLAIPEPSTAGMVLGALLGALVFGRRRNPAA